MNYHQSQFDVNQTIDLVMTKGGEHLYHRYLKNKIPAHANQEANNMIQSCFESGYLDQPRETEFKTIQKPTESRLDYLAPGKVSKEKYNSMHASFVRGQKKKSNIHPLKRLHNKPNLCFRLDQRNFDEHYKVQMKLRKQKKKQQRQKSQELEQERKNQEKELFKKQKIVKKMNDLKKRKIPCCFDDQGKLIVPNFQDFRKNQLKKRLAQNKIFAPKYQTVDFKSKPLFETRYKSLTGKKRGFASIKHSKSVKVSEDDFNNHDQRQQSAIPFLRLSEGIKLVETERNVVASRSKQTQNTRGTYVKDYQKKFFKSFIPEAGDQVSAISMQTFSAERGRPNTTDYFNRTHQTTTQKAKNSILWRPTHTSESKRHRLNVNNAQLIKQIVQG